MIHPYITTIMSKRLNIGSIDLGETDHDRFKVMIAMTAESARAKVSSIVSYFVRNRWAQYKEMIEYEATKHGLTFDECFARYLNNQPLEDPAEESVPVIISRSAYARLIAQAKELRLSAQELIEQRIEDEEDSEDRLDLRDALEAEGDPENQERVSWDEVKEELPSLKEES